MHKCHRIEPHHVACGDRVAHKLALLIHIPDELSLSLNNLGSDLNYCLSVSHSVTSDVNFTANWFEHFD